jgi:hypothetical protein
MDVLLEEDDDDEMVDDDLKVVLLEALLSAPFADSFWSISRFLCSGPFISIEVRVSQCIFLMRERVMDNGCCVVFQSVNN